MWFCYMPKGSNVAVSHCILSNAKQGRCHFHMRAQMNLQSLDWHNCAMPEGFRSTFGSDIMKARRNEYHGVAIPLPPY